MSDEPQVQVTMSKTQYDDYIENYLTVAPNVCDVKKPKRKEFGDTSHPTIKPEKLMEWLVKLLSNEGDTVLDLFNGSGTTGVAAVRLKRNYIGIDMNKEYCEQSDKRIADAATD